MENSTTKQCSKLKRRKESKLSQQLPELNCAICASSDNIIVVVYADVQYTLNFSRVHASFLFLSNFANCL